MPKNRSQHSAPVAIIGDFLRNASDLLQEHASKNATRITVPCASTASTVFRRRELEVREPKSSAGESMPCRSARDFRISAVQLDLGQLELRSPEPKRYWLCHRLPGLECECPRAGLPRP